MKVASPPMFLCIAAGMILGNARLALANEEWVITSDEAPPAYCSPGLIADDHRCRGSNCDIVSLRCVPSPAGPTEGFWTDFFSEEGDGSRDCGYGYAVGGLACTGNYCDNVALYCVATGEEILDDCYWGAWISEETNFWREYLGYVIRGFQCSGNNCDNMRPLVCRRKSLITFGSWPRHPS